MIRLVSFHTSHFPVDAGILDPLANADTPFPSAAVTYSIESEMRLMALSSLLLTFLPAHIGSFAHRDVF